ncbi:hypothetical protein P152DRAFT_499360 [Eremomyces bilateralis CBS 781.70]|uniref:Uncharacterized protein n=1 Tax=Eremomyces bilateralis CBS 781.70 TaxID=1392243 RepID=A0A6G1FR24_9PEZI|nr:uncharacterized protein P152DRAFT_499360 [Eremomyces bilateralis CBS 781.70]KAF1808139.1 hypothetical protein P152DRAFT_499360 [Eremomyces bilateralis CBS 781.70]
MYFFFYGSLTEPDRLARLLQLKSKPAMSHLRSQVVPSESRRRNTMPSWTRRQLHRAWPCIFGGIFRAGAGTPGL